MVAELIPWCVVSVGVLVVMSLLFPYVNKIWTAMPWKKTAVGTTVMNVADKTFDYVDEIAAVTAIRTAALLFKKHGDTESAATLASMTSKIMTWDDETATTP